MQGLTIVYTGEGKGKTTAALGMALRSAGHGMKVLILQFIKSSALEFGEHKALKALAGQIDVEVFGEGFIGILGDKKSAEKHLEASKRAFKRLVEVLKTGKYQMIICDEIFGALHAKHLTVEDLLGLLSQKPVDLHLVLTGRNAPKEIIQKADLVSEIKEIKHPYQKGIQAQKGIEF